MHACVRITQKALIIFKIMKVKYTNYLKKVFYIHSNNSGISIEDTFTKEDCGISSGYVTIIKIEDKFYVHLSNLKTQEEYREMGNASRIIDAIKAYSRTINANGVHIYCKPELKEFYRKREFKQMGIYEDHLEMVYENI